MKTYKYLFAAALCLGTLSSCHDLDIMPKDVMTNNDVFTDAGVESYFAALYSRFPMEDFNVSDQGDHQGFYFWNNISWDMNLTGESVNRNNAGFNWACVVKGYWSEGYSVIRQCNSFIANLDAYKNQFSAAYNMEAAEAEARFLRAYTYFSLVKRYGGVPLLKEAQELDNDESKLWVARSSHKECVDFILEDLDYAIAHLGTKKVAGRANKFVAAAIKSRVALYAGSVARYGGQYDYTVDGVQVCGLPAFDANNYFKQAYDASKVVEEGGYALYNKDADKAVNFKNIFMNADNSDESVFVRQYNLSNNVHSFDAVYCPPRMTTTYGDRYNPTLDWVELFDGLPKDPATGHLKTTDDEGNYIVYDNEQELFKNAEPRLKGSIMIPGETYKGITLELRAGLIKPEVDPTTAKIKKFVEDDGQTTTAWNKNDWFKNNVIVTTTKWNDDGGKQLYQLPDGSKININGKDGPANGGSNNTLTGFHGLKWINTNWSVGETQLHRSTQTWIDVRYAEVLLNRAEAAIELAQNGEENYDNVDMLQDAMTCINKIRERAGATLLASKAELANTPITNERGSGINSFVFAPNVGLHVVRVERYKELAFEHKIYWDLRRWFTFDTQIKQYRRRMLTPFMFAKGASLNAAGNGEGKYIYDTRVCERANGQGTFTTKQYYDKIPDGERTKNPLLVQNDQY